MPVIKWLGKMLLWSVIVVIVLVGALLLVNAVDEDLNPEAAAALKPALPSVPEPENGFFVIAGFHAPAGEDPHAYGRRWLAEVAVANSDQFREADKRRDAGRLDFTGMKGRFCRPESESCLEKARRNSTEVRRLIAANEELFRRYESLSRYSRIDEVTPPRAEAPILSYSSILNAQSLKLAQISLMIEEGRMADALGELERDLALHRKFAAGSTTLINLMISQVTLSNGHLFLADILRAKRGDLVPHAARITAMSTPPRIAETALQRVFDMEFRFGASMLRLAKDGRTAELFGGMAVGVLNVFFNQEKAILGEARGLAFLDPLVLPFLKERATLNMSRLNFQRLAGLSRAPAGRLAEEYLALQKQVRADVFNWRIAYNPLGKLLIVSGFEGAWTEYLHRIHDVDGTARLVTLQAQILLQGIPEAGIAQFLAASDKKLLDPYTNKPMQWDAAARQLWFEPRSEKSKRDKIGGREGRLAIGL